MDEYKKLMALHYFNNSGASYSYNELLMILGFQVEQLDLMLDELISEELIKIDQYLKVTEKGMGELKKLNLHDVEFENIEEDGLFTEVPMSFTEIYIPKRFNKKFK